MKDWLLTCYYHLPGPARSFAATLRGIQLRRWRYGSETERLVEEALERERWSSERWKDWQNDRLACVLHRAARTVPYYREQWADRRRRGDRASWECLENWPLLEKDRLRENPTAFVADDCDRRRMFHVNTSGTTGKALEVWYSRKGVRDWYALFEARWRRWYGVSRTDRWAILGGQQVAPFRQSHPPFWVWNAALSQLYMSSYHLSPTLTPHYLEALRRHRVSYLYGYTSSLYELALEAQQQRAQDLKMKVVVVNAEPLFQYQRETIEDAFKCPVRESYGMAEMAAAASECEHGRLHLWPEVARIDVLESNQVTPSGSGEIVSTTLLNVDMPLVRYRVGDCASLPGESQSCDCGRGLPILESIDGRLDDLLFTAEGRRIGRLDPVFKGRFAVREAQIIQETLDRVRVRYVPAADFSPDAARSIIDRLQSRMGDVRVVLEHVDKIPRGANGKFRAVVCNLAPEVRRSLDQRVP